ncbi:MAG: restriction endonuclease subunit S [Bacteroidia bacterium]|nr:restriction endonuclease subunit S [Bacteroidia bacterium]
MRWEKVEIGQLGEVVTGNTPPRKNPELYGDFIPFIKPTDIEIDRRFTPHPEECYSELGFEKYRKSLIPKGATCVVTIGSIGKKITQAITDCFINQAVNAVIPNENYDADFVFYLLKNNLDKVKGLDSGTSSGRENVSKSSFSSIEVKVVKHLPTQRRIASILSAYDDLIENNLKRIKLLEEKAFLRYKQIVREEKMEVEDKLENLIQTVKRKFKIPKSDYKEKGDIPIIDQSTDFIGGYTNEKDAVYEDVPMIVFGDHTRILKYINFPFACGADGTQLVKPENSSLSVAYLYFELISCNLSNYHYARHFKFLKEQVIKLPSEKVMQEYQEEADKIFNLIQIFRLQNTKLREARDILLPRLMSGEIEV